MDSSAQQITLLLERAAKDRQVEERLYRLVEQRFHSIAAKLLRSQAPGHSLQATLIADDAFLKLMGGARHEWINREQFFCMAARVMRQLLVDHARLRCAEKRNRNERPAGLDAVAEPTDGGAYSPERFVELAEIIDQLAKLHPEPFKVFDLHYFSGWDLQEIANEILGIPYITVKRRWQMAKAFLREKFSLDGESNDE